MKHSFGQNNIELGQVVNPNNWRLVPRGGSPCGDDIVNTAPVSGGVEVDRQCNDSCKTGETIS
jgi:hypothetical protein